METMDLSASAYTWLLHYVLWTAVMLLVYCHHLGIEWDRLVQSRPRGALQWAGGLMDTAIRAQLAYLRRLPRTLLVLLVMSLLLSIFEPRWPKAYPFNSASVFLTLGG
jgi:hypothetical protein